MLTTSWFSVPRCERTTHPQTVLWPVPLHRDDNMGEEILHPDRQPAGAAQQGEGGETLMPQGLPFIGKRRRQLSSSPLYFTHLWNTCKGGKGKRNPLLEQVAHRRLWVPNPCRCSRPSWIKPWATWSSGRFNLIPYFLYLEMTLIWVFFLDSFESFVYGCYRLRVRPASGVEQIISQLCSGLFAMKYCLA